jgi:hypothetical protein
MSSSMNLIRKIVDVIECASGRRITRPEYLYLAFAEFKFQKFFEYFMVDCIFDVIPIQLKQAVQLAREVDGRDRRLPA